MQRVGGGGTASSRAADTGYTGSSSDAVGAPRSRRHPKRFQLPHRL
jgi:hypothetical protein